jgi:hypothetical protein
MSNVTYKLFTDKMGGNNPHNHIGDPGELFYNPDTGSVRISDGETRGGLGINEVGPLESLYIGPWVHFVRPEFEPDVVDKISDTLWIKRDPDGGDDSSIFNAAPNPEDDDAPFDSNGGVSTPFGTEWNTYGWADFSDITDRYSENFVSAHGSNQYMIPMHEWVMHDTVDDKYYAIRFLSWDGSSNGATGAFSYIRRQINTAIYFNREDADNANDAGEGDVIAQNLVIQRGEGGAIYNNGQELDDRWTEFANTDTYGATWETDGTLYTEYNLESDFELALTQLKVGDEISIDDGDGGTINTTIAVAFNPDTGSFRTVDAPQAQVTSVTVIYMNLTKLYTIEFEWENEDSPKYTLWNQEGWDDLTNLSSRQFTLFDDVVTSDLGKHIVGKELVMHDTQNDKYYAIKFTRWQQSTEGTSYPGFSYTRRLIDTSKVTSGLKFNDGSIQTTAYTQKAAGTIKAANPVSVYTRYITPDDIGKMIIVDNTDFNDLVIKDGGGADFPVGSTITIVNISGATVNLSKDNDDEGGTIYGAGTEDSSTGWDIPDSGGGNIAVLIKIRTNMDNFSNDWMLSGSGITVD